MKDRVKYLIWQLIETLNIGSRITLLLELHREIGHAIGVMTGVAFNVDDIVHWTSNGKTKTGVVEHVLDIYDCPAELDLSEYVVRFKHPESVRGETSYLVAVYNANLDTKPRLYWPRTRWLRPQNDINHQKTLRLLRELRCQWKGYADAEDLVYKALDSVNEVRDHS